MFPTQTLPGGYQEIGTLDITKNVRMMLLLNVLGIAATILSGWVFFRAVLLLRSPGSLAGSFNFSLSGLPQVIGVIVAILALSAVYVTLHEAVHGVFFWWFTRSRPLFAFRWTHAYAAAPGWYIPRNKYLIITLAPLLIISLLGLLAIPLVPASWLLALWFVLTMNAGGAIGDVAVAVWLLRLPATTLSQDRGDAVTLYRLEA